MQIILNEYKTQWTALVTGRYMITMMVLLCYVNLSEIPVNEALKGGQFCTDHVDVQQDGVYNTNNNRLAIIPNFNFTCNGTITSIRAKVVFNSSRNNYPFFQVWRRTSVNSTVYNRIGEVRLQSDDQVIRGSGNYSEANITLTGNNTIEVQSGDVVGYYHPPQSRYRVRTIENSQYIQYRFIGSIKSVDINNNTGVSRRQPLIQFTIAQCLAPTNADFQCPNGTSLIGDTCTFSCNAGYQLQGSNNRTCLANQSWSGGDSICVALNCSTSPPLNNSQLQSSCDTQYQSTCTTDCVDGYTGVGGSYTCVVTDEDTNSIGWNGSTSCQRASSSDGDSESGSAGAAIGGAVGGVVFFFIIISLVILTLFYFKHSSSWRVNDKCISTSTTSPSSRPIGGDIKVSQSVYNEIRYSGVTKPLPQSNYEETDCSYLIANSSSAYETVTAAPYEVPFSSYEVPSASPYELAESEKAEKQIYATPYEDEENYGPIYSVPPSDIQKIYEEFEGKKLRKLCHTELKILEELGTGEFGVVTHAKWTPSSNQDVEVAIKTLNNNASDKDRLRFLQEAAIMCQFDHHNVIKLHGVVTEVPIMIVLEYMSRGDLRNLLIKLRSGNCAAQPKLPIVLLKFCQEVAAGMIYLSGKQFVHRDLAARNILVSESTTCKIGDFGMSRDLLDENYYVTSGGKIPVKWTAPEAMYYRKYSVFSDVWSYGCVLYEIWSLGCKPFGDITNVECLEKVGSGYRLPPPPGCPRAIYRLMMKCWNPEPKSRPQFGKISKLLDDTNSGYLLYCSDEDKQNNKEGALKLGLPLEVSNGLFYDLQTMYTAK